MVSGSGVGNAIHKFLLCWSFRERRRKRICIIKRKRFVEDEPDFQGGPMPSNKPRDGLHVVSSAYFEIQ